MSSDTPRTRALITRGYSLIDEHTVLLQLCTKLEIENAALRAKVGELEQDKARLDWLEEDHGPYGFSNKCRLVENIWFEGAQTIRQAIDAARSKEQA